MQEKRIEKEERKTVLRKKTKRRKKKRNRKEVNQPTPLWVENHRRTRKAEALEKRVSH